LKNKAILWIVSCSTILVLLSSGIESNAVSYWIGQGNILFDQGNYSGAIYAYNKAIGLGNQTNAPIFTGIVDQCGYRMDAVDKENKEQVFSKICAEPTGIDYDRQDFKPENLTLSFDVSNPNSMHMRIASIYVNVNKYNSIINPEIIQNFAKGYDRGYFCIIKPLVGPYKCVLTEDYDFIDLAPDELEHIVISIGTNTPGTYVLGISLEYAIGSETNKIAVGEVPVKVGFFDRSFASEASG